MRLLHDKKRLLRIYTQNIDGLEKRELYLSLVVFYNRQLHIRIRCFTVAGIPDEKLVEAHGTFATATCRACSRHYSGKELEVSKTKLLQMSIIISFTFCRVFLKAFNLRV